MNLHLQDKVFIVTGGGSGIPAAALSAALFSPSVSVFLRL